MSRVFSSLALACLLVVILPLPIQHSSTKIATSLRAKGDTCSFCTFSDLYRSISLPYISLMYSAQPGACPPRPQVQTVSQHRNRAEAENFYNGVTHDICTIRHVFQLQRAKIVFPLDLSSKSSQRGSARDLGAVHYSFFFLDSPPFLKAKYYSRLSVVLLPILY